MRAHAWRATRTRAFHGFFGPLLCWLSAAALAPAAAQAPTQVERRVDARAEGRVEIVNVAGSVAVSGWDRHEVEVTGTLSRGIAELEVDRRGGTVAIEVDSGGHASRRASAHLEIRLPRGSEVRVDTVSADVLVADLDGEVEVESVSGAVEVRGRPRAVEAKTVSGDVDVEDAVERISAQSVSGTIELRGGSDVEAGAVSGSIRLTGSASLRRAELDVVSGRIEFAGALAPDASFSAASHNGSIELALPAATSARFEVSSFSGRITNELGPEARRVGSEQGLEFTLGSGDARIRVESFSGSITLRRR